ncbi:hypothetical protein P692DRAFT_20193445 [Suillus brevipes Sb2]|nr:hypothetical protein P692DRAFT_20193445 [Suillus brevipes Sb2]
MTGVAPSPKFLLGPAASVQTFPVGWPMSTSPTMWLCCLLELYRISRPLGCTARDHLEQVPEAKLLVMFGPCNHLEVCSSSSPVQAASCRRCMSLRAWSFFFNLVLRLL